MNTGSLPASIRQHSVLDLKLEVDDKNLLTSTGREKVICILNRCLQKSCCTPGKGSVSVSVCSIVSTYAHASASRLKHHASAKSWSTVKKTAQSSYFSFNMSLDLVLVVVVTVFFFSFFFSPFPRLIFFFLILFFRAISRRKS